MNQLPRISRPSVYGKLCLAEFLPYRMNAATQAISQGLARHYADAHGISVPEWRIIATLGEFSEMTARDIAGHSRMSKVMTSRASATLLKRKLVTRRKNREDRRESFLRLTVQGEAIYAEMVPKALEYQAGLKVGLSKEDLLALERILGHFMQVSEKDAAGNTGNDSLMTS